MPGRALEFALLADGALRFLAVVDDSSASTLSAASTSTLSAASAVHSSPPQVVASPAPTSIPASPRFVDLDPAAVAAAEACHGFTDRLDEALAHAERDATFAMELLRASYNMAQGPIARAQVLYYMAGISNNALHDAAAALEYLNDAIVLNPDEAQCHRLRAMLLDGGVS